MNVLLIPEDFTKDQYVVKPVVEAMFKALGWPRAKVRVCLEPRLGGVTRALDSELVASIVDRYRGMTDIFLLLVDRDGNANRRQRLNQLETEAQCQLQSTTGRRAFFGENAWQEIEVWALAGHDLPADWSWSAVRAEADPKERYFEPFALQRAVHEGPGGGRKALAEEAAKRFERIRQLCPEDIGALHDRIDAWMTAAQ